MTTPRTTPERLLTHLAARSIETPEGLVERTMRQLDFELARRRRVKRAVHGRLAVAAFLSLPVVIAVNVVEAYVLYGALARYLPVPAAGALTAVIVLSMLLTLALAYGSLPLLANLGLRLREQAS